MCLGIPGRVVALDPAQDKLAIVDVAGVRRSVNLACLVDAQHPPQSYVGAWVLVHVGFAMSRIDPEEAQRTLDLLRQLGEIQAEAEGARSADTP